MDRDKRPHVEIYTSKLDMTVSRGTASLAIVISATRGSVEDVNAAMQIAVNAVRQHFLEEE